jgi:hypothetical protein
MYFPYSVFRLLPSTPVAVAVPVPVVVAVSVPVVVSVVAVTAVPFYDSS